MPHARIVRVERNADMKYEALGTATLEEHDGRTKLTQVTTYPTQQMRDWLLTSGMTQGIGQRYDHLDEYVASQQQ